jgi:hypothetical protein
LSSGKICLRADFLIFIDFGAQFLQGTKHFDFIIMFEYRSFPFFRRNGRILQLLHKHAASAEVGRIDPLRVPPRISKFIKIAVT